MVSYTDISYDKTTEINCCPRCNSSDFIKYGSYKNNPRFKCKDCERTFSLRTNTPWYYSKKTNDQWKEFCLLLMECKSLKYCANHLKINIATAFYWRHKILNALKSITSPKTLSNQVFMHHCFVKENFKGSKNPPHEPREKLWIVLSYDSYDNSLTLPYSRRGWNLQKFEELVYSKITAKTYIFASGNRYIQALAARHNKKLRKPANYIAEKPNLGLLHTFNEIMRKTRGIATKYLLQYFSLVKVHFLNRKFNISTILHTIYNSDGHIKCHQIKKLTSLSECPNS